ncbi:hypothetical protein [Ornithinibacillus sp. FSL M8-0202]|uniref:hypothetical protein n=1 Tax=Ornithinibacillus sp. FSL M8-0202 TaxID=2921616 RepID=UPI0030CF82C1
MSLIRIGVALLFGAFTKYAIVMLCTQWLILKKLQYLGVADSLESEVFDSFWTIFTVEIGLSILLIIIGLYKYLKKEQQS